MSKPQHLEHKKHIVSISCTLPTYYGLLIYSEKQRTTFLASPVKVTVDRAFLASMALLCSPFHADTTLKVR